MAPKPKKVEDLPPGAVQRMKTYLGLAPPPKTKVPGVMYRIKNMFKCHWRGLLGWLLIFLIFGLMYEKHSLTKKVEVMWVCILLLFLIRPINIPVTAMFPIFYLPMTGTMSSRDTCLCYMNADIILFLLSSMIILLLNNCGNDRRLALAIMTLGDADQHSMKKMVYKCSIAAYILGMLSNRLVSCSMITEYFTTAMMALEKKYGASDYEPDLTEIRYVVNNAIQTSSAIGSIAIVHSSTVLLCFRAIFNECVPDKAQEYPDIFNYLQYSAFAFPVSLIIYILNLFYHMILINRQADGEMSNVCTTQLKNALAARKAELPPNMTLHEKLCIAGLIIALFTHVYRWNYWLGGWTEYMMDSKSTDDVRLPAVKDATISAIFAVLLHSLPCGFSFVKYTVVSKRKDLPKLKPESGILWWKYVDKNINYGYFFLIGSGVTIMVSSLRCGLCDIIAANSGTMITNRSWTFGMFIVMFGACIIGNVISPTAATAIFLPFALCAATRAGAPPGAAPADAPAERTSALSIWAKRAYLVALGTGAGSVFSFVYPYLYTPAYFCHYVGKVPKLKMVKYSLISVFISFMVLWLAVVFYAPVIWDPSDKGYTFLGSAPEPEAPAAPAEP